MVENGEDGTRRSNGEETLRSVEIESSRMGGDGDDDGEVVSLLVVLNRVFAEIFFPGPSDSGKSVVQRIKVSVRKNGGSVREASRRSVNGLIGWTRRGGPFRALLVISVGSILLLALTGFLVFMLFFLAATMNAIVISLLMSLAAAGGFLALFFACMAAIYIGALSIAVFVISTATIATTIAVLVTTGWIGFFVTIWLVTKKSFGIAKHSLSTTGSALSAYSSARQARRQGMEKASN
ncbi:hypothetical protein Scep_016200 [Stephania cephalantha]|uniref:Uncharacterized protein n=1 Tax=Stephania cephalantha TaxID=152367 RepID=A0AAP0IME2_9MAGN